MKLKLFGLIRFKLNRFFSTDLQNVLFTLQKWSTLIDFA